MSKETIYRQDAIDAIDLLCQEHRYKIPGKRETYSQYNEAWQDALDRAEGAIFNLPSAQPEPCEDAVGRDAVVRFLDDWISALDANCHHQSMADLKIVKNDFKNLPSAQPEQRWIPVSERLPEVHESGNSFSGIYMQSIPVLVYGICEGEENAQFHVVTYCDDLDGNTYWATELDAFTITKVTAWMPLPEPYEGDGHAD